MADGCSAGGSFSVPEPLLRDPHFGVDQGVLLVPGSPRRRVRQFENYEVLGGSATVRAVHTRSGPTLRITFNPSRIFEKALSGRLAKGDAVIPALAEILDAISSDYEITGDLDDVRVGGLDVARDFCVAAVAPYIHAWTSIPHPTADKKIAWFKGTAGIPNSAYLGGTARHVKIYNKGRSDASTTGPSTLRWEARFDRRDLHRVGISGLTSLTDERIVALALRRWAPIAPALKVIGQHTLTDRVRHLLDPDGRPWSVVRQERFLGHMLLVSKGQAPPLPKRRRIQYRRAIEQTGVFVHPSFPGVDLGPWETRYLDFETGVEVVCDPSAPSVGEMTE